MRVARRTSWCALAVAATATVAGCGGDDADRSDSDDGVQAVAEATASSAVLGALTLPASSAVRVGSPVAPTVVLERDGLGIASFGDSADATIATVTAVLGEPDQDSGWVEPLSIGTCAGTEARFVAWGSLYLYFSDESGVADGDRHFFGYSYGSVRDLEAIPEGLATPEGIGLGTSVEFLRATYGDVAVEAGEEGLFSPNFYVDEQLSGRLTGVADDDLVTVIIGGDPCGVSM
jgi:hypothetical protein